MHARVTTLKLDPSRLEDVVGQLRDEVPQWYGIDGFKGFTVLLDRRSGKLLATSYWESREAMEASDEQLRPSRERAAERGGARRPSELELVLLEGRHRLVTGWASGLSSVEGFEVAVDTIT